MKFSKLLESLKIKVKIKKDFEVTGLTADSRNVAEGNIFVAIEGCKIDGFSFIKEAALKGAGAIICKDSNKIDKEVDMPIIGVPSPRKTLNKLLRLIYKAPLGLKVIGVTGTNGKTTVTFLLEHLLKKQGFETGTIGTINYRYKQHIAEAVNTTPDAVRLSKMLRQMANEKVEFALLEVSSHALVQHRADSVDFNHCIFTNLSSEHLDFHRSMEDYFKAKARLFTELKPTNYSIINIDDEFGKRLSSLCESRVVTFGFGKTADIKAKNISLDMNGSKFDLCLGKSRLPVESTLIGRHNIYNILAASAVAYLEGMDLDLLRDSIASFGGAPGRLQKIDTGKPYSIFIDYAHTPAGLESVISSLRECVKGRIITVFGCGGDRDKQKRPLMGEIATRLSDIVVLTNDNPRYEEPLSIIEQIKSGIKEQTNLEIEPDRKKAVKKAFELLRSGDCLLIAGKGHEAYQVIKDRKIILSDFDIVKSLL